MILNPGLRRSIKRFFILPSIFLLLFSVSSQAAELVMFESDGCDWCETWNDEIGVTYDKTTEAGIVPLRRVDIDDDRPADLEYLNGLIYTPTFIVIEQGREVGRITGYPGEDFFWQLLNEIIEKMDADKAAKS
jgi:hypothetical protein